MITPHQPKLKILLQKKYDLYLVFLIGLINSFALTPSITSSLGITSLEDGPIQPAIVYKDPSIFLNDFHASEFQRLMWTTSTKWLPAVLYKYLNIDPIFFHVFFTYAQTVLMLIGTFYLANSLFKSRQVSYISVAFAIAFSPYFNNFASYGDQFFMPYGTWISIGPLLLAWASAIENKKKKTFLWLFVGASIHPAMALSASFAILAFTFFSKPSFKSIRDTVILFTPALLFSFIALIVRKAATAPVVPEEWYLGLKQVFHWYAWKLNPATTYFETTAYTILLMVSIYVLTQSGTFSFSNKVKNNCQKLAIIFIILYGLQAVSFQLGISELYSISFGRFSIFTSIFAIIIFAACISHIMERNKQSIKIHFNSVLLFCLLIPSFINFAVLGSVLLFHDIREKKASKRYSSIVLIFIVSSIAFGKANYYDNWWNGSIFNFVPNALRTVPNYLPLKMIENLSMYSWLLILLIFLIYRSKKLINHRNTVIATIIISFAVLTLGGRYILSERRDLTHKDWVETQLWALNNSPKNSKFIVNSGNNVYESWSTLSRRPRLIADLSAGFLYFYTKEDFIYDQKRARMPSAPDPKSSNKKELELFYLNFSEEFGGNYVVWRNDNTNLQFRIVFQNEVFTIYRLT